ncbi:hypothetical protein K4A83_01720 [Spirulina subsalsa FACHB-351]|uniref:Biotin carboxylase n=1 Tax=Spirulina subsalsa FACHB-351 TaxID=234711 RepID=A0ABT3L0G3_9CYAN|nr:hypothetical protein [Spirulina subsalsa]MCW6034993.1 hypothetical protein [Spirulina subsalsa FACHB-351]
MKFKACAIALLSLILWVSSWVFSPPSYALTSIKLKDIGYQDCPPELAQGAVMSMNTDAANCYLITGTAINETGKYIVDADVFGRIYDANGNPAMQNRTRLGTIPEVPPGESTFEIPIFMSATQPTPLQLKQFKASGFTARVRPFYYDDFENN